MSVEVPAPAPRKQRSTLSVVLQNITSSWATLLVNTAISFILSPIVVNHLGSVYYGIWSLLMQFTGYLWLLDFGVRESVVKYVAQYRGSGEHDKLEATVRTAISVYGLVTIVAMMAVGAMTWALPHVFNIPPEAVTTAQWAALTTGFTVAQSFLSNVFVGALMGLQRFYLISQLGIVFSIVRALGTYWLLTSGYGLVELSVLNLTLSMANAGMTIWYCHVLLPEVRLRPSRFTREEVTKLFNYGKYVLLANIGDKVVFASDAVVIGMFLPIAALTPYAIAGTLITQMRSVFRAMGSIINPLASNLSAKSGNQSINLVLESGAKGSMAIGLPLCIGFITLGEPFIRLWMGPEHAETAGQVMTVLSIGYMVGLPYYTISGILYGLGQHRIVANLRVVEGAINLALSMLLVRSIGLVGVALGTALPHIVIVGVVLPRALPKIFPLDLAKYYVAIYARPLAASIPFLIATSLIRFLVRPDNLVAFFGWGVVSLGTYLIPLWLVALSEGDRQHVLRAAGVVRPAPAA